MGKNIKFPKPYKSDLVIENKFTPYSDKKINQIIKKINEIRENKKILKSYRKVKYKKILFSKNDIKLRSDTIEYILKLKKKKIIKYAVIPVSFILKI